MSLASPLAVLTKDFPLGGPAPLEPVGVSTGFETGGLGTEEKLSVAWNRTGQLATSMPCMLQQEAEMYAADLQS